MHANPSCSIHMIVSPNQAYGVTSAKEEADHYESIPHEEITARY